MHVATRHKNLIAFHGTIKFSNDTYLRTEFTEKIRGAVNHTAVDTNPGEHRRTIILFPALPFSRAHELFLALSIFHVWSNPALPYVIYIYISNKLKYLSKYSFFIFVSVTEKEIRQW